MGINAREWYLFVALLISSAFVTEARAQGACACDDPSTQEAMSFQPDLSSSFEESCLTGGQTNMVSACKTQLCSYDCRSEGAFFTIEGLWIDVFQRGNDLAADLTEFTSGAAPSFSRVDPQAQLSPRITAGWLTCDGIGFRVRYWNYSNAASVFQTSTGPTVPDEAVHFWATNVLDVEGIVSHWGDRAWDSTLSAGYRFVDYRERATTLLDGAQLSKVNSGFLGNGFTGSGELRYSMWRWFGLVANGRGSMLLGNDRFAPVGVAVPTLPSAQAFDAKYIFEAQLAVEARMPICGGGYWFARGGYEAQYWNDFAVQIEQRDAASVVFSGFFLAFGLQR